MSNTKEYRVAEARRIVEQSTSRRAQEIDRVVKAGHKAEQAYFSRLVYQHRITNLNKAF